MARDHLPRGRRGRCRGRDSGRDKDGDEEDAAHGRILRFTVYGSLVRLIRHLAGALCVLALVPPVAGAAVSSGAYGNLARFDRLTGQKTEPGLVFLAGTRDGLGRSTTSS